MRPKQMHLKWDAMHLYAPSGLQGQGSREPSELDLI